MLTKQCEYAASVTASPIETRILVIDDDPSVGAAIRLTLERKGRSTQYVSDAHAGIRAFETGHFDLVITDLFMREMNGLKAIAEIRDRAPMVPILAISGFRFRDSMDPGLDFLSMAAKVGATAGLRKPFTPGQLTAAVEASLQRTHNDVGGMKIGA
jgi:DNA-binding response OmpR family regulator